MSDANAVHRGSARTSAVLAACALAGSLIVGAEGWVLKASPDPIGKITACAGVIENVKAGQRFSDDECAQRTAQAIVKNGAEIDACIDRGIPLETRAAMTSFAYNVGPSAFCSSTAARNLNAGDLAGACAELSRWTHAGGRVLPGLVTRRAQERALCERGLNPPPAA